MWRSRSMPTSWSRRPPTSTATPRRRSKKTVSSCSGPDDAALGVRRLEALRRAHVPRTRGRAGTPGDDPQPVRLVRPTESPELVGRPSVSVHRDPARRELMDIHGDGHQVRTFTYVSDTVDGFVRAIRDTRRLAERSSTSAARRRPGSSTSPSGAAALGSDVAVAGEVRPVRVLAGEVPGRPLPRAGRLQGTCCSASRHPSIWQLGLSETAAWHRERRRRQTKKARCDEARNRHRSWSLSSAFSGSARAGAQFGRPRTAPTGASAVRPEQRRQPLVAACRQRDNVSRILPRSVVDGRKAARRERLPAHGRLTIRHCRLERL